ncbi:MAG: hypothetical protein IJN10_07290 [Firmicutes bacterium]|nr:hypothetical protein [Bacillota bacterium]
MADHCEECMHYTYDDEYECYICEMDLDQDEMEQFMRGNFKNCPFYEYGDEYKIVRKQM